MKSPALGPGSEGIAGFARGVPPHRPSRRATTRRGRPGSVGLRRWTAWLAFKPGAGARVNEKARNAQENPAGPAGCASMEEEDRAWNPLNPPTNPSPSDRTG